MHIERVMAILISLHEDLKQIKQTKGQGHLPKGSQTTQVSSSNSPIGDVLYLK